MAGQDGVGVVGYSLCLWLLPDWTQFHGHFCSLLGFPARDSVLAEKRNTEEQQKKGTTMFDSIPSARSQVSRAFF